MKKSSRTVLASLAATGVATLALVAGPLDAGAWKCPIHPDKPGCTWPSTSTPPPGNSTTSFPPPSVTTSTTPATSTTTTMPAPPPDTVPPVPPQAPPRGPRVPIDFVG